MQTSGPFSLHNTLAFLFVQLPDNSEFICNIPSLYTSNQTSRPPMAQLSNSSDTICCVTSQHTTPSAYTTMCTCCSASHQASKPLTPPCTPRHLPPFLPPFHHLLTTHRHWMPDAIFSGLFVLLLITAVDRTRGGRLPVERHYTSKPFVISSVDADWQPHHSKGTP